MPDTPDAAGPPTLSDNHTRAKQLRFLEEYSKAGNVSEAADKAEMHRDTHYGWMERDPAYKKAWEAADSEFCDSVRGEVRRRAIDGWNEPIVYQGFIAKDADGVPATVLKKSDRLLELLAKAKCPEFKEEHKVTGKLTLEHLLGGE